MTGFSKTRRDVGAYDAHVLKLGQVFNRCAGGAKADDKEWAKAYLQHMAEVDQYTLEYSLTVLKEPGYSQKEAMAFAETMSLRWQDIRNRHTESLKGLLRLREWFNISDFGAAADDNAWLLVQHADQDPAFQKKILGILEKLYPAGETAPANYAYLYDRVAASLCDPARRRPERYGTQGICDETGKNWAPLEEPERLAALCSEMGLNPAVAERHLRPPPVFSGWGWNAGRLAYASCP